MPGLNLRAEDRTDEKAIVDLWRERLQHITRRDIAGDNVTNDNAKLKDLMKKIVSKIADEKKFSFNVIIRDTKVTVERELGNLNLSCAIDKNLHHHLHNTGRLGEFTTQMKEKTEELRGIKKLLEGKEIEEPSPSVRVNIETRNRFF